MILRAHRKAHAEGLESSDDGSLALALGANVKTIPGDRTNIKVTYPEDIAIAEAKGDIQAAKEMGVFRKRAVKALGGG